MLSKHSHQLIEAWNNVEMSHIEEKRLENVSAGEGDYHDNVHSAMSNGVSQSC